MEAVVKRFLWIVGGFSVGTFLFLVTILTTLPFLGVKAVPAATGYFLLTVLSLAAVIAGIVVAFIYNGVQPLIAPPPHPGGSIGLFMDVDETLTDGIVQQHYAKRLGCEPEFLELESKWRERSLNADQFGDAVVRLFSSRGLTRKRAREYAPTIPLRPWADPLLKLKVQEYLVSSGPSYFVEWLANEHQIPTDHVVCSEYVFDDDGVLVGCNGVSPDSKSAFVEAHIKRHVLSIGIGDDPEKDGPFLSRCTLPIVTRGHDSTYLVSPSMGAIVTLIGRLSESIQ